MVKLLTCAHNSTVASACLRAFSVSISGAFTDVDAFKEAGFGAWSAIKVLSRAVAEPWFISARWAPACCYFCDWPRSASPADAGGFPLQVSPKCAVRAVDAVCSLFKNCSAEALSYVIG